MIEFEDLYLTPNSLSRLARKLRGSMSQREVAEKADVSQSNVSKVENDPGSRPGTAVRIIEAISDYEFADGPRYRVTHRPGRDFSGDTYESLAYHLRVLFFIGWKARSLLEVRDQYPGRTLEERYIETDEMRLKVGAMSKGAVIALQDLLEQNLIDYNMEVYSFEERQEKLKQKYRRMPGRTDQNTDQDADQATSNLRFSEAQIEAAVQEILSNEPGKQGPDCWYLDDGAEVSLEGKAAYCSFSKTQDGHTVMKKMGGGGLNGPIANRLLEEEEGRDIPRVQ